MTLTVSPTIEATQRVAIPGSSSLQIDSDLMWTVEFATAKAVGMGLELPLSAVDWAQGYDLLLVVGTKGTFSVSEANQQIQSLLDGHHYTRGLAFVRPGTPTSNLPGAPSGYPPPDPGGAMSFAVERGTPVPGDGLLFANELGISAQVVAHLDQTSLQAQSAAQAMLTALWPATLGYHLEQMMAPSDTKLPAPFDANAIAAAYDYTRSNVRPGGALPAFRIGSVPYGLRPATSVTRRALAAPGGGGGARSGRRSRERAAVKRKLYLVSSASVDRRTASSATKRATRSRWFRNVVRAGPSGRPRKRAAS